ncbi:nuclear transport factor 2 family protein [Rhizomonospora bruguierae]|uniref:nuclear transport factor 2 family protein n=1 Tax=Rhizomonospora bruguierae TaxID=1581705 RepID=UPI001BCBE819|nr:nuclear transport factor 2 family protein [Micromonospora sp. NBRC 107566]
MATGRGQPSPDAAANLYVLQLSAAEEIGLSGVLTGERRDDLRAQWRAYRAEMTRAELPDKLEIKRIDVEQQADDRATVTVHVFGTWWTSETGAGILNSPAYPWHFDTRREAGGWRIWAVEAPAWCGTYLREGACGEPAPTGTAPTVEPRLFVRTCSGPTVPTFPGTSGIDARLFPTSSGPTSPRVREVASRPARPAGAASGCSVASRPAPQARPRAEERQRRGSIVRLGQSNRHRARTHRCLCGAKGSWNLLVARRFIGPRQVIARDDLPAALVGDQPFLV